MEEMFSKCGGGLLHIVCRKKDISGERDYLTDDNQLMQVCVKKLESGQIFKPHSHIYNERVTTETQEAWVIISGSVKVDYYDTNNELLCSKTLSAGDCSVTLKGGHGMVILEDDTMMYEFKNGPYFGQERDKIWIEK